MAKQITCRTESLPLALAWEKTRLQWLRRNRRLKESLRAEAEVIKYEQRMRAELGVAA